MSENGHSEQKPRKRSLTELTLGWLAERLRKTDSLKEAIKEGKYDIDSKKIAESLVSEKQ